MEAMGTRTIKAVSAVTALAGVAAITGMVAYERGESHASSATVRYAVHLDGLAVVDGLDHVSRGHELRVAGSYDGRRGTLTITRN